RPPGQGPVHLEGHHRTVGTLRAGLLPRPRGELADQLDHHHDSACLTGRSQRPPPMRSCTLAMPAPAWLPPSASSPTVNSGSSTPPVGSATCHARTKRAANDLPCPAPPDLLGAA